MNFNELVNQRESCRNYNETPVDREKLISILEVARLSPSACNSQPWRLIVVDEKEKMEKMPSLLQRGNFNKHTDNVPVFIVVCETKAKLMEGAASDSQYYAQIDIGIITANITLAATAEGLSTCIMGCFDEYKLKELLSVPEDIKIKLVLAVGYAKEDKLRKKVRKNFEEIVSFNKW